MVHFGKMSYSYPMRLFLYVIIFILGSASYVVGIREMFLGKYRPSTFSRVVWALIAVNNFAGVVLSHAGASAVVLGGIFLAGNIAICLVSFWKGTRTVGRLELLCLTLLLLSGLVWVFYRAPLVNLGISLFAHFIGGLPTYKRIWRHPKSESAGFWGFFFFASLLSVFATETLSFATLVFPVYFALFDGSMFFLSLRKERRAV